MFYILTLKIWGGVIKNPNPRVFYLLLSEEKWIDNMSYRTLYSVLSWIYIPTDLILSLLLSLSIPTCKPVVDYFAENTFLTKYELFLCFRGPLQYALILPTCVFSLLFKGSFCSCPAALLKVFHEHLVSFPLPSFLQAKRPFFLPRNKSRFCRNAFSKIEN